jgi:hypothetical protein
MGAHQRLDRLARIHGVRERDHTHLCALYEALCAVPDELGEAWPQGTAEAIMRALMRDASHEFVSYDHVGNRTLHKVVPFHRDAHTGRIHWEWAAPYAMERLDYQESWADGITRGNIYVRVADGNYRRAWRSIAMGGPGGLEPDAPTPRELRRMVVDRARALGEVDVLARALGIPPDAWVLEAPGD